ncbi:MAG TPA: hypothetical protein VI160_08035 [Gemmatimonadales bacterium]
MTADRQEPPLPSRARAAGLVADIMKQRGDELNARNAGAVRPGRRRSVTALLVLLPLALGLTAWNLLGDTGVPEVFSSRERAASIRFQIFLAQQAIEAFHDSASVFPRSLSVIGLDGEGVTYVPGETTYELVGRTDSLTVTFHRGDPIAPYSSAAATLQRLQAK